MKSNSTDFCHASKNYPSCEPPVWVYIQRKRLGSTKPNSKFFQARVRILKTKSMGHNLATQLRQSWLGLAKVREAIFFSPIYPTRLPPSLSKKNQLHGRKSKIVAIVLKDALFQIKSRLANLKLPPTPENLQMVECLEPSF